MLSLRVLKQEHTVSTEYNTVIGFKYHSFSWGELLAVNWYLIFCTIRSGFDHDGTIFSPFEAGMIGLDANTAKDYLGLGITILPTHMNFWRLSKIIEYLSIKHRIFV